jgi:DUF971 family protein
MTNTISHARALTPTRLEPLGALEMQIDWNDGASFGVPYFELRFHCPCAGCVDEHTGERTLKREKVLLDIRPTAVHLVGRYAVQMNWSDGHSTGMYHFDRLRELCEAMGRKLGDLPHSH